MSVDIIYVYGQCKWSAEKPIVKIGWQKNTQNEHLILQQISQASIFPLHNNAPRCCTKAYNKNLFEG